MPKSKREKLVSLTRTKKRSTPQRKEELINAIRDCVTQYQYCYVFDLANCRSQNVKDVRSELNDSRLFMTRNKIMMKALGEDKESEYADNLHHVSKYLVGLCGLIFTNRSKEEMIKFFREYEVKDFARSGQVAEEDFEIPEGPIEWMPHSMEELLLSLELPVELKNGVITMRYGYQVCKKGDVLTPKQCKILKHFGKQLSTFKMALKCMWTKETTQFEVI
jgi:mRNA turnover protein 4